MANYRQSRAESIIEVCLNTASGFALAWATYRYIVIPYMQGMSPAAQAWWVTWLFTIISLVRSYVWRRFFNAGVHRIVHNAVRRFSAWCVSVKPLARVAKNVVKRAK